MKRVIIIGASYAGLSAVKEFSKCKNIEVVLFDKNDYHYVQVESYSYVSTLYSIDDITINIKEYVESLNKNIKFHKEKIDYFDSESNQIFTDNNTRYTYDYLIIATGSLTNFPIQVPNIRKYSIGIKTLQSASKVEQIFNSLLYKKNNKFNIVIGGAGLSGVEVAAEMATIIKKKNSDIKNNNLKINIIIVDGMKTVLPNMDRRLVEACKKRLDKLNIKMYLGSFIKDVEENRIYLANNTVIDYDYFIFTGGIKAVSINSNKNHDVNKLNQYIVNENLRMKNEKNIYVVGDAAEITFDHKYIAPTAQLAIQTGKYVSRYIQNEISYKYTEKFNPKSNGILISLGGKYALGLVFNKLFIRGYIAFILKSFVNQMHKRKFVVK